MFILHGDCKRYLIKDSSPTKSYDYLEKQKCVYECGEKEMNNDNPHPEKTHETMQQNKTTIVILFYSILQIPRSSGAVAMATFFPYFSCGF